MDRNDYTDKDFVDCSKYVNSHGKRPSGRGLWVFQIGNNTWNTTYSAPAMLYSKARKDAIKAAKGQTVYVLP